MNTGLSVRMLFQPVLGLAAVVAVFALVVPSAIGRSGQGWVDIAGGRIGSSAWGLATSHNRDDLRCYRLLLAGGQVSACESDRRPLRPWRRVVGLGNESAAVELDVTAPSVRRLRLFIAHPGKHGERAAWQSVNTQSISLRQARQAQVKRDFRFAVLTGRGSNLCVEKVVAFDRAGRVLEKLEVPCEF